jgi:hypothetical protein
VTLARAAERPPRVVTQALHGLKASLVCVGGKFDPHLPAESPDNPTFVANRPVGGNQKIELIGNIAIRKQSGAPVRDVDYRALTRYRPGIGLNARGPANASPLMIASIAKHEEAPEMITTRRVML